MASGGEGSRNLNKGKGPLQDLLEHQGDDVSYNDRLYHEFLQSQFGSDLPRSPNPPLLISDEPDPNLYDLDSNENLSTPQPPSNEFVAGEEEKPMKSDLFKLHMKKIQLDDGMIQIKCNYCSKIYRTNKSFGYDTYWNHIRKNHPSELALLYELYDEYLKIYGPSLNMPVSQHQLTSDSTGTSSTFKLKGLGDRLFSQRAKKLRTSSSSSSGSISELDRYLETSHEFLEDSEFSIQVWWKDHEQIFPILAIIAKQILGTPVSTVAVEQEFSAGGNILEPRRSVICPQTLEAQACLDDWTKAKYRQQEIEAEIVNDFFEDDQTTGTEGSD
ncbi:hypothetical protein Dsin_012837 [Dipteronia sinensis]|uniref:HAT C-terminal dimerisation domain-containing protein n=1 Tax=Dipteronia sinensis TaxID=43782 RepID=A0AAE0AIV3_9ROSI|nr:hypothetical protein Dsin_012837 [Dipteronia sinensis]